MDEGVTIYDIDTHFVRMKEPELDKAAVKKAISYDMATNEATITDLT